MPAKATVDQRISWHLEHQAHCGCRAIPARLLGEMRARGLSAPRPSHRGDGAAKARRRDGASSPVAARPPSAATPDELVSARREPDVVAVPARTVIALEGRGSPDGAPFRRGVAAVFGVGWGLKTTREPLGGDFRVGPLEARWWAGRARSVVAAKRAAWRWELRLGVPADVAEADVARVVEAATTTRGGALGRSAEARRVAVERIPAARMGRILHVGPYANEGASFARLGERLAAARLVPAGPHLEIYLSDPRRTAPARLKTVLLVELA